MHSAKSYIRDTGDLLINLKEMRNSSKIRPLDLEKK